MGLIAFRANWMDYTTVSGVLASKGIDKAALRGE
jgi:hypothetical protein